MSQNFEKFLSQAKESIKVLELLQKEALSRAKSAINLQNLSELSNDKLASSLRRLGFATQDDLRELERKIEDLASELRGQLSQLSKVKRASTKKEKESEVG